MNKFLKYFLIIYIISSVESFAKENFFNEAKNLFDRGKYEESKFLLQRNIIFNPKIFFYIVHFISKVLFNLQK